MLFWTGLALFVAAWLSLGAVAATHALLHKRDPRAAWGWIATCLLLPYLGTVLYWALGIDRVEIRARRFGLASLREEAPGLARDPDIAGQWRAVKRTGDFLLSVPLVEGNHFTPLYNGEQAFPAMLEAIRGAQSQVLLATYIFENDEVAREFVDALADTAARGVTVRLLIDAVGSYYSLPAELARRGLRYARFNPPRWLPPAMYLNLRNHRKLLLVDGRVAFTGGMNIDGHHMAARESDPDRIVDVHFRLQGPIVTQLGQAFAEDWRYVTGERLRIAPYEGPAPGMTLARTIQAGPNERWDRLSMILQAAIAAAQHRVRLMTPYFLPTPELALALQGAAARGVAVELVLPGVSDHAFVRWAMQHRLGWLLDSGIRAWDQPPPFVHSKLLLVDGHYALIGSANIDPRSLRLNFELCVESYGGDIAAELDRHFDRAIAQSVEVTAEQLSRRRLPVKLRDGLSWLFSLYL